MIREVREIDVSIQVLNDPYRRQNYESKEDRHSLKHLAGKEYL